MRPFAICLFLAMFPAVALRADEADEKLVDQIQKANPKENTLAYVVRAKSPKQEVIGVVLGCQKVTPETVKTILGFKKLVSIGFGVSDDCEIDPEALRLLEKFPKLQGIQILAPCLKDGHLKILSETKQLHLLNLIGTLEIPKDHLAWQRRALVQVVNEPFLLKKEIEALDLSRTQVTGKGLKYLSDCEKLSKLALRGLKLDDEMMEQISKFSQLQKLDLSNTDVERKHLKLLRGLKELAILRLTETKITDEALVELVTYPKLRILSLEETAITDEGLATLGQIKQLRYLALSSKKLTPQRFRQLAPLKELLSLELNHEDITDELAIVLNQIGLLHTLCSREQPFDPLEEKQSPNLKLDMYHTKLTEIGVKEFLKLKDLSRIHTNPNQITDQLVSLLIEEKKLHLLDSTRTTRCSFFEQSKGGAWRITLQGDKLSKKLLSKLADLGKINHLELIGQEFSGDCFSDLAKLDVSDLQLQDFTASDEEFEKLTKLNLTSLTLGKVHITPRMMKAIAQFKNLVSLDLFNTKFEGKSLRELAPLQHLRGLWLSVQQIDDDVLQSLRKNKQLHLIAERVGGDPRPKQDSEITYLKLDGTSITDVGLLELLELPKLVQLSLVRTRITDEGVRDLCRLKSLRALDLSETAIQGDCLKNIAKIPDFSLLRLTKTRINDDHLLEVAKMSNLKVLSLDECELTSKGLMHLVNLKKLRFFTVSPKMINDDVLEAFSKNPDVFVALLIGLPSNINGLRPDGFVAVNLSRTQVTDRGLKFLSAFPKMKNLELTNCQISGEGLAHLKNNKELTKLVLVGTQVDSRSIGHLAECQKLQELWLWKTKIDDNVCQHLEKIPNLQLVYFSNQSVSDAAIKNLQEKRPKLAIEVANIDR